jgi:acyl-CoA synthetase (NDP forming)
MIDAAAEHGVRFADISEVTRRRLGDLLDPGLPAVNPLDAWGTGRDYERVFAECMQVLLEDPDTAALAFAVDLSGEDLEPGYSRLALEVFPTTDKPFVVLANLRSAVDGARAAELRRAGVPVLEGTATGLAAFRALFDLRDHHALPPPSPSEPVADEVRERWRARLRDGRPWDEVDALALLGDYGIPVVAASRAATVEEAMGAAEAVGFPVALKTAEAEHKTDVGGVHLDVRDESALRRAFASLAERLGPRVTVAAMAPRGVELALGVLRDAQFGPLVMAAAGGELIEILRDRRLALPPVDEARARRLLDRLAVRPLLDGARGRPPADIRAVARAVVRLSALATDLGELVDAVDINPLIAGPEVCVAVDALVLPRA